MAAQQSLSLQTPAGSIELGADRCAWVPEHRALLVADVHIGKAATFRALGVPVPQTTTDDTLERLSAALERRAVDHLWILGDFLHAATAKEPGTRAAVTRWRTRHPELAITLITGNHDRRSGAMPEEWGIVEQAGPIRLGAFELDHEPDEAPGRVDRRAAPDPGGTVQRVAGHVHPAMRLGSRAQGSLRLPCFWLRPDGWLVLPAFGSFTGGHSLRAADGGKRFVVGEGRIWSIPGFGGP